MKARAVAVVAALMMSPVAPWGGSAGATPPPPFFKMVGGGTLPSPEGRATFGLTLECAQQVTNQGRDDALVIRWAGNLFRLTEAFPSACDPNDPEDNHDGGSHEGVGTGQCNGEETTVSWELTDGGKGHPDLVDITVGPEIVERIVGGGQTESECTFRVAGSPKGDILFGKDLNHTDAFLQDPEA